MTEVTVGTSVPTQVGRVPVNARATTPGARAFKRTLDILVSVPAVLFLLISFPLLAIVVRLDSPGPVLFRQKRVGRDGELFGVLKLRTMRIDAEAMLRSDPELWDTYVRNGYKLPADCDPRVTPLGAWLRRTSLDELPQFFCVLRGTMSLVGPRPVLPDELQHLYQDLAGEYTAVKPGLTGLWQVSGRSSVIEAERARLDAQYIREWTPLTELSILVRTIPAVLMRRGAH